MNHIDWPTTHYQEFLKHWALSKLKAHRFFLVACLCSLYLWKFNFGQSKWDKSVVLLETYWEEFWELGGNPLQTWQENSVEQTELFWLHLNLLISCMKIMVLKLIVTIFGLG
jgi:hypothetical protein